MSDMSLAVSQQCQVLFHRAKTETATNCTVYNIFNKGCLVKALLGWDLNFKDNRLDVSCLDLNSSHCMLKHAGFLYQWVFSMFHYVSRSQ